MSDRAPNVPARMIVLAMLCGGSSWGIRALGPGWPWAVPLGIAAGVVLWGVLLALDHRRRPGCRPGPPDLDPHCSGPIPRIPDPTKPPSGA